ncbi:3TM-type holin [Reichenbachiella versicolor]|uniref:3TM-type holin n=1 Tax=Reichenbachiella versicolor TaxID=1821036 RepID=UPI000D6E7ACC|nr:3TM-type holin [Reichenbachiella versicolor]
MGLFSKIFSKGAKDILSEGGKIVDNLSTSDDEKLRAKNELSNIVFNAMNNVQNAQRDIITAEASGNWLQRSWRPIVMLTFAFIVVYAYFIEPAFVNTADPISKNIDPKFWTLLEIGIGGYVVGRSAEKIATTVTKNVDIPFVRKKDRKDIFG